MNIDSKSFKCDLCLKVFTSSAYLLRHKQTIHKIPIIQPSKRVTDKPLLILVPVESRSAESTSGSNKPKEKMDDNLRSRPRRNKFTTMADPSYSRRSDSVKKDEVPKGPKRFECAFCLKLFTRAFDLMRHKQSIHKVKVTVCKPKGQFPCRVCQKLFRTLSNRLRHEKSIHGYQHVKKQGVKCPECDNIYLKEKEVIIHLQEDHSNDLEVENVILNSYDEFKKWKEQIEKETASCFVQKAAYKRKCGSVEVYMCHRSGRFKSKSKGIRRIKRCDTNKIQCLCPANIRAERIISDGTECVAVTFLSTHLGHECEVSRLPLSKNEKDKIAEQLCAGVAPSSILNHIYENTFPTERLAITTTQDLRNIAASYGINPRTFQNQSDITSIQNWVKEIMQEKSNPILICKLPGECSEILPHLSNEDFVLGFMNDIQEELFRTFGNEIVSIDSTRGNNKYNIQLASIVIKGNNWEGLPVAFLWSSRQTEEIYGYFFHMIQNRIGNLQVKTFLSDDIPVFYNAFSAVFGPSHYYICPWYLKRAWEKALSTGSSKITNIEKRQKVLNVINKLAKETDKLRFEQLIPVTKAMLLGDEDTAKFGKYFVSTYLARPAQWAACFRTEDCCNAAAEKWHTDIKCNGDLKGKYSGRLDKAIHSLMEPLQMKLINGVTSLQGGKLVQKLDYIEKVHNIATEIMSDTSILQENDNIFSVTCALSDNETYKVTVLGVDSGHRCNLRCSACGVCIHQLKCNCRDSVIRYDMCKHIHVVSMAQAFCLITTPAEDTNAVKSITEFQSVTCELEESVVANEPIVNKSPEKFKEEAVSAMLGLFSELEDFTCEEQYKEVAKRVSVIKNKCRAIASVKRRLPPVVPHSSQNKNNQ